MSKVPSNLPGRMWILCNWAECSADADDRYQASVRREAHDKGEARWAKFNRARLRTIYLFCSERHALYWRNSVVDNNNLPSGSRGTIL